MALVVILVLVMVLAYADLLFVLELFYGSAEAESACSERGGERRQGVQALEDGRRRSVVPTTIAATAKSPGPVSEVDAHVALAWAVVEWGDERGRRRDLAWLFGEAPARSVQLRHERRRQRRHQALQPAVLRAELASVSAHFTLERRCRQALQTALRDELRPVAASLTARHQVRVSRRVLEPRLLRGIREFDRSSLLHVYSPVRLCMLRGWCVLCAMALYHHHHHRQ